MLKKPTYEDLEKKIEELEKALTGRESEKHALGTSMQKLALHIEQTPLGVIEWNLKFEVVNWNPGAEKIFGFKQKEALGQHASFIIPDASREHVDEIWNSLLNQTGGMRSTNDNITKTGHIISCGWYNTPLIDLKGKVIGVASLVMDITARKQAENALRESESKYRLLVENQTDMVVKVDIEGRETPGRRFNRVRDVE